MSRKKFADEARQQQCEIPTKQLVHSAHTTKPVNGQFPEAKVQASESVDPRNEHRENIPSVRNFATHRELLARQLGKPPNESDSRNPASSVAADRQEASDLDFAIELLTDPRVMKFIGEPPTEQQLIDEMPLVVRRAGNGCIGIWNLSLRETGERLGDVFLLPLPVDKDDTDWDLMLDPGIPDCEIELGYILKPAAWGLGYASEAAERLIRFAFEETPLSEVVAVIDDDNAASRKVLLKTGFTEEGMRRAYAADCPGFRITRERWSEIQANIG